MTLTCEEALERTVARLEPLFYTEAPFGLSCSGTDVPGAEVQRRFELDAQQFVDAIEVYGIDKTAQLLVGMFAREFWMGYAFGEAAD